MTIQGARDELINMMECKDIPFYFVPIIQKVVETIEMEIVTGCDIDAIRAEIEQNIPLNDGIEGYNTGYAQGIQKALQIIDRYTKGE